MTAKRNLCLDPDMMVVKYGEKHAKIYMEVDFSHNSRIYLFIHLSVTASVV
jgi:hypothetical protein